MRKLLTFVIVAAMLVASASALTFQSDTSTLYTKDGGINWFNAVATWVHPAWTTSVAGTWIWDAFYVSDDSAVNGEAVTFQKTFELPTCEENQKYTGTIDIAADNTYVLKLNGNVVDSQLGEFNYGAKHTYDISSFLTSGVNTLTIDATNLPLPDGTPTSNPAGIVFAGSASCGNTVPEFGVLAGAVALIGAVAGVVIVRKRH